MFAYGIFYHFGIKYTVETMIPHRLMVGHYALNVGIVVRIHVGKQKIDLFL